MEHKFEIFLYKKNGSKQDITETIGGITWSGEYQQAARKLDIEVLYAVNDKNQPTVIPDIGDIVSMSYNGSEQFRGVVWSRDLSSKEQFIKITCFDALIYLTKSNAAYNFKNTTAEAITRRVCGDFKIPLGSLASTGGVSVSNVAMGMSPYDIIISSYTKASRQNGKKYMPIMQKGLLNVIEKGVKRVNIKLDYDYNVQGTQFVESLDSMVNKVVIYDDKGNVVNHVQNDNWVSVYGIIQDAIQVEEGKNMADLARKQLKPIERKANVESLGEITAITGNAIVVLDKHTGLNGLFYIDGDSHTFKNNVYSMSLTIAFENIMDEKEVGEARQDSSSSKDGSSKDGGKTAVDNSWLDNWEVDDYGNPTFSNPLKR